MRVILLVIFGFFLCDNAFAQDLSSDSSIIAKIDSIKNSPFHFPSSDLLPPEFNSSALENEYYCESDSEGTRVYRGNVFLLKLRDNCTFIYETYYQPYNWSRIEFVIGTYIISRDTIYLTYKSLLSGKTDQIYLKPTLSISWRLPDRPKYLLVDKTRLSEPTVQRLKKGTFYKLKDKPQFDLGNCK